MESDADEDLNLPTPGRVDCMRELAGHWVKAQPVVFAYVVSVVRDFHLAEDLLQEVAETAATRFELYDSSRPFVAWTLGISKKIIQRHFRRVARELLVFNDSVVEKLATAFEEIDAEVEPRKLALRTCMDRIRGRRRLVLEMRYQRELQPHEIATRLGVSRNAVQVILHRVRRTLGECVKRQLALE
jgi:RNA polymerase sigma-70 factor (ECF subfamily)